MYVQTCGRKPRRSADCIALRDAVTMLSRVQGTANTETGYSALQERRPGAWLAASANGSGTAGGLLRCQAHMDVDKQTGFT